MSCSPSDLLTSKVSVWSYFQVAPSDQSTTNMASGVKLFPPNTAHHCWKVEEATVSLSV